MADDPGMRADLLSKLLDEPDQAIGRRFELPSGGSYYDQPVNGVLWVALAEKAYAEANAAGYVTSGNPGVDSYDALDGGQPYWAIQAITGKASSYTTNLGNLASDWSSGKIIVLGSDANPVSSEIVPDHAYAVVGYNASSSTPFTVYNPWGPSANTYDGHPVSGQYSANAALLAQNYDMESIGTGAANGPVADAQVPISPATNAPRITFGVAVSDAATARVIPGHLGIPTGRSQAETFRLVYHPIPKTVAVLDTTGSEHRQHAGTLAS